MSLRDRFRIDELSKVGSKAVPRDGSGVISVRKVDNKEIKPVSTSSISLPPAPISTPPKLPGNEEFPQLPLIGNKTELPQPKKTIPITKADTVEPIIQTNPNQESFSGETTGYLERPIYNENELKLAIDVKVDELIKKKKRDRGEFVRKSLYDSKTAENRQLNNQLSEIQNENSNLESQIASLESTVSSLESQVESIQQELVAKEQALQEVLQNYEKTVGDLQTAVINGTKEGIERASLAARVQGLGAQRDTLIQGTKAQAQTINTLRDNIAAQREAFQALLNNQIQTIQSLQQTNARLEETIATNESQSTTISALEASVIQTNDAIQETQTQLQEVQEAEEEERSGTFFGNLFRSLNPIRRIFG